MREALGPFGRCLRALLLDAYHFLQPFVCRHSGAVKRRRDDQRRGIGDLPLHDEGFCLLHARGIDREVLLELVQTLLVLRAIRQAANGFEFLAEPELGVGQLLQRDLPLRRLGRKDRLPDRPADARVVELHRPDCRNPEQFLFVHPFDFALHGALRAQAVDSKHDDDAEDSEKPGNQLEQQAAALQPAEQRFHLRGPAVCVR